jgi:phosphatidylglycerophosphatase C
MARKLLGGGAPLRLSVDEQLEDIGIVAYDFDGTITCRDSFMAFLKWRVSFMRFAKGMVRLIPAAFLYLFHQDRGRLKAATVKEFLEGMTKEALEAEALSFCENQATGLMRPDAIRSWRYWQQRQARLVIVTASPDIIIAPFARGLAANTLIATELEVDENGRITGAFATPNCRGREKVSRLRAMFGEEIRLAAAYGDTSGDTEMLKLAEHAGYREFRERP